MMDRYFSSKFGVKLISLTVSEKMSFTVDGRTTDACVTTVALLCSRTQS